MNRLGVVVLVWGLIAAAGASAASPDPRDLAIPPAELARAKELVRRLGSEDYKDREAAQGELAKMKRLARPVLAEAAAADPSPEVRSRAARLLPKAEADELQARIDTFLADAEGKFEHDLPAWKSFRGVVGTDKPSRDLYVEMLHSPANLDLLVALDQPEAEAAKAIADRRMTIYLRLYPHAFGRVPPGTRPIPSQPPSVADVAALLFAEVLVDAKHIPRAAFFMQISAAAFLQQPAAMSAATGSGTPSGEAFKRLLAKWFETRTHPDDLSNYNLINAANMFRTYPETTPLLRRVVMTDGVIGYQKSQALMFLIQRNGKDEQAFLRSLVIGDKEREEGGELLALAAAGGPGS
ncbi:MAG TPA: hypothetical protein VKE74_13260, partial [Gemmataceae bacterium]|nr:hypothetical protein [Gemmataceae bacterium]